MKRFPWLVLILFLGGWELFRSPNPDVERGNQAFRDGRYDDALKAYDKAAEAMPNDPGVRFNRGVASYQKAQGLPPGPQKDQLLGEAQREFEGAQGAKDPKLRSSASYNLGNTHFQKENWDQAIKSYAQSIKDDPGNLDARHNLEMAVRKKKQPPPQQQQGGGQNDKQQPKDGQGQQQQPKDQQGQGQQDQQQKPQDGPGQPQDQPQPQPQQQPGQGDPNDPRDQKDQKDQQDPQDPQQQPKDQPSEPKEGQEPRERPTYGDAESKMDALERRSKDLKVKSQGGRHPQQRRRPGRDW